MVEYAKAGHGISDKREQEDFTKRIFQFFNHNLKGAPAPQWMTRGIPAKMKGIDDRLELEREIKTRAKDCYP